MKTRVKELRQLKHKTQLQLALAVGCSQNSISRIELGEAVPNGELMIKLSDYFNVSLDYIMCRDSQSQYSTNIALQPRVIEYAKKLQLLSSDNKETVYVVIDHLTSTQNREEY